MPPGGVPSRPEHLPTHTVVCRWCRGSGTFVAEYVPMGNNAHIRTETCTKCNGTGFRQQEQDRWATSGQS